MSLRAEAGVPAGSPLVEIDGVQLAVSRAGRGPALVCLHAVGHGGGDFAALAAALADRFEVIRVDWPGQGRSGPDRVPASAARYAALLGMLLERLGILDPILIGCSIGGAAAILHAAKHPVRALVLCDSGGLVPINAMTRGFTGLLRRLFAGGVRGAWWYRPFFAWFCRTALPSPAAAVQRERIIAGGYETAPVLAQAWASFGRPDADIRAVAASLDVPVWVAWCRGDRIIPLSLCRKAIEAIPNATLTRFKGGHAAFLEQPEEFTERLLRFIASLPLELRAARRSA
jgi:4,5:9,10-diseco-3-hydroxy-5,9,17-trioxoandrosta-1(10),2-diene-4-oate hydrolase